MRGGLRARPSDVRPPGTHGSRWSPHGRLGRALGREGGAAHGIDTTCCGALPRPRHWAADHRRRGFGRAGDALARGTAFANATMLTRDVGNAPPSYLTAERLAEVAERVAAQQAWRSRCPTARRCARLRRPARRQRRQRGATAMIKLTYRPHGTAVGLWPWSARASCTTRAASTSSPATRCTCR